MNTSFTDYYATHCLLVAKEDLITAATEVSVLRGNATKVASVTTKMAGKTSVAKTLVAKNCVFANIHRNNFKINTTRDRKAYKRF